MNIRDNNEYVRVLLRSFLISIIPLLQGGGVLPMHASEKVGISQHAFARVMSPDHEWAFHPLITKLAQGPGKTYSARITGPEPSTMGY